MMAAYGVDVLSPGISPRRLAVLIDRLPPSARYGGEAWTPEAHLLALAVDHLATLTYVTLRASGSKGAKKPKPVPRPPAIPPLLAGAPTARPTPTGRPPEGKGPGAWRDAAGKLALLPGVRVEVTPDG